jgi:hypothetical protein
MARPEPEPKDLAVRKRRLTDLLNYIAQYRSVIDDEDCRTMLETLVTATAMVRSYETWLTGYKPIVPPFGERLISGLKSIVRRAIT